jgi:cysteine synthase B
MGFSVYVAGGLGTKPEVGHLLHEFIPAEDVYLVTGAVKHLFDKHGNRKNRHAALGAAYGIPITLCMPSNVSKERKRILSAYGATVIYTDPGEGSDGAIRKAQKVAAAEPEKYFYADQYSNENNWRAH